MRLCLIADAPVGLSRLLAGRGERLLRENRIGDHQPTVAVDLDGTIAVPGPHRDKIRKPRHGARKALKKLRKYGCRVIINTVRGDKEKIKSYLDEHDIPYDYINENPDQPPDSSGKVYADLYIDDRGLRADEPWRKLVRKTKKILDL